MASDTDAMTPAQAAQVLHDVRGYEETLTARAAGMTLMVWGLAAAGVFLTYNAADPYLEDVGRTWLFNLLWIPWIAAGILFSGALWASHSISMRQEFEGRRGVVGSLLATLLFFVIAAALFVGLDVAAGIEWTTNSIMLTANGLFAIALATLRRHDWDHSTVPVLVIGVAMTLAGIGMGLSGLSHEAAGLLGAAVAGSSWFGAGIVTYRKG